MLSPFLTLNCPCNEASLCASQSLTQNGLRVLQTFDLHKASHILKECPCPFHGTGDCDCQMIILLVYGNTAEPATLILHGNNGRTWVSVADPPLYRVNPQLVTHIQQALEGLQPANL